MFVKETLQSSFLEPEGSHDKKDIIEMYFAGNFVCQALAKTFYATPFTFQLSFLPTCLSLKVILRIYSPLTWQNPKEV